MPAARLAAQSRRDFLLLSAGIAASAIAPGAAPRPRQGSADGTRATRPPRHAGRTRRAVTFNREKALDQALTFDDDVAEALYSKDRHVRIYRKSDATPLRNNYHGRTPGPEHVA
jgi:hypothetical protein